MKNNISTSEFPKCNQCGFLLILLEEKRKRLENNFSDLVVRTYKCSNTQCQEEIDKKITKQAEAVRGREVDKQNRMERMKLTRRSSRSI